jgi:hypothetical protein
MGQRVNVLWGIVLTLLCAIMIWIGYSNYRMSKQVESLKQQKITLGTDAQLKETVNTLERNLNERMAYETHVTNNPFDLTKAIVSRKFLASLGMTETLEEQGRMRLSCTVMGDTPSAIVKFMGRSQIIREGDEFNGFRVAKITSRQAILTKGGASLVLVNESAPESELSEGQTNTSVSAPKNY